MTHISIGALALAFALASPLALARGPGKGHGHGHGPSDESAAEHAPGHGGGHGAPTFSRGERDELQGYFGAHPADLPPGLAKQGKVPPGWQKKLARGKPVPDDLWEMRVPLPQDILIRLPPPPPGVVLVRIADQILKVREQTHEVLDRMGIPHPP